MRIVMVKTKQTKTAQMATKTRGRSQLQTWAEVSREKVLEVLSWFAVMKIEWRRHFLDLDFG